MTVRASLKLDELASLRFDDSVGDCCFPKALTKPYRAHYYSLSDMEGS